MKLAILFERLGPYHHARMRTVGEYCDLTVIEFSAIDNTYSWDKVEGANGFKKITLFTNDVVHGQSRREICRKLWETLNNCAPNAVAIPGWATAATIFAIEWCRRNNIPSILMSDSQAIDEPRKWWKEWLKSIVVRQYNVGFVAGIRHRDYLKKLQMDYKKIFSGYDVVDNEHFSQGVERIRHDKQKRRMLFGLPDNYFLKCTRFVEKKNLPRLVAAYAKYHQYAGENAWHLVIVGDGPLRITLEEQINKLGLGKKVHLPGFKQYNELPDYYSLANVYIQASTTEQWGLVVNEAMASGLPVIVSNRCGCAPDLVIEGRNGYTFDPFDVDELAQLMKKIAKEGSNLASMGQQSRKIVNDWSPESFAVNLLEATETAILNPMHEASWFDYTILKGLSYR